MHKKIRWNLFVLMFIFFSTARASTWLNLTNIENSTLSTLALGLVDSRILTCQQCQSVLQAGFVLRLLAYLKQDIQAMLSYSDRFSVNCSTSFLENTIGANCSFDFSNQPNSEVQLESKSSAAPYAGYVNRDNVHRFFSNTFVNWKNKPLYLIMTSLYPAIATTQKSTFFNVLAAFRNFICTFNKVYNETEWVERLQIFTKNVEIAENNRIENPSSIFETTKFYDITQEEFKQKYLTLRAQNFTESMYARQFITNALRNGVNKVNYGDRYSATLPIRDQGICGSCWAFSTVGNIEYQYALTGKAPIELSVGELVSCDTYDAGCNGGFQQSAISWILANKAGKVSTAISYPYTNKDSTFIQTCNPLLGRPGALIKSYLYLTSDEEGLANYVATQGTVLAAVDSTSWQYYTSGILTECVSSQMNHAVLIVGFDRSYNPPYWIVKNSWGSDWGERGYIRIVKGKNTCLIASSPSTVVMGVL